jgi:hypothetical protein
MPAASTILLELLRPPQQRLPPSALSRVAAIRNISTLITCCDFGLVAGESNYELCKQAQSVFSKGLDLVLHGNEEPLPSNGHQFTPDMQQPQPGADPMLDTSLMFMQDPEWNSWLETLGLESETWMDSLDQPAANF